MDLYVPVGMMKIITKFMDWLMCPSLAAEQTTSSYWSYHVGLAYVLLKPLPSY